jgi:glucose-6-phosphate-specific signal transduction histidine kinase
MNVVTQLQEFRQAIYKNLCSSQDATFELMDALLLTRKAQSLADLSLSIAFRRQWSSVYEALQDTRARSRTINEALHRTNSSIRMNCARRRLARVGVDRLPKPSRNVLTNIPHRNWEVVR